MNGLEEQTELLRRILNTVRIIMWLLLAPLLISLAILVFSLPANWI